MARRRKRGTGGIYQRANGSWTGQVTVVKGGKRIRKSYTSKVRGDVEFLMREAQRAIRAGLDPDDIRHLTGDYLDGWVVEAWKRVRPSTAQTYRYHVNGWIKPAMDRVPLMDLRPIHVQRLRDFMQTEGKSPHYIGSVLVTLRMALRQAVRDGLMPRNVADGVKPPQSTARSVHATSPEEARAIMDAFDGHRLHALVIVAIGTGMRLGELLGLRWQDIHDGRIRITGAIRAVPRNKDGTGYKLDRVATKTTRSIRTLDPSPFVLEALEAERKRQAMSRVSRYVFATPEGEPLDPRNTTKSFQTQLAHAGLPRMRFHDLRHATATVMLAQGIPLRVIQEALGHRHISTTAGVYAHVLPSLQKEAADKLQDALAKR